VPLLPQVPEKPPHALHAPYDVAPHEFPAVDRVQACDSEPALAAHTPPPHV
jgi:hypothetical protein